MNKQFARYESPATMLMLVDFDWKSYSVTQTAHFKVQPNTCRIEFHHFMRTVQCSEKLSSD